MKVAELTTWEQCKAVTEELLSRQETLHDESLHSLDQGSGVYMLTYSGTELGGRVFNAADTPQILFIGASKPTSSRHFKDGTTGNSTIRRSLAALLASRLDLMPVPRSQDASDNDRYDNYMLAPECEVRLTAWMQENIKAAYIAVDQDKVEAMQKALIDYNVPMLNFQHNPANKYGAEIKIARKKLATAARKHETTGS